MLGADDDCPPFVSARPRPLGGVRGPVRRPLCRPRPAAGVSRVLDRAARAAGAAAAQRLQFFLSESTWNAEQVNDRRLDLLRGQTTTAPHGGGVIVIDDSGDRKDGTAIAHVGRQWLGRLGKTDNGIVTVTTVWTDGRVYYPLHATCYTPAHHFARGR
nr:transposase [Streptomyces cupreus]